MKDIKDIPILQVKNEFYTPSYPWALDLMEQQNSVFWRFDETNITSDYNDLTQELSTQELHGITEVLRLFTQYEIHVGNDYWGDLIKNVFGHPEIKFLATTNSYYEVVHSMAYNEINKALRLDTEEFYTTYKGIPELNERIQFITSSLNLPEKYDALDILKAIGTFLFIEGAVLYTGFAFIKHFSSNGKNLLKNINAAIDYSIRDEGNIHVTSNEHLFKTLLNEAELTQEEQDELQSHLEKIAVKTYEHEQVIIDRIFSEGSIRGITPKQMQSFIKLRINECISLLGYPSVFEYEQYNPIQGWFYDNITTLKLNDFFSTQSSQYSRKWDESKFIYN